MTTTAQITAQADALLARHGVTAPPIDVEHIATSEGLILLRQDVGNGVSGVLLRSEEHVLLGINKDHHPRRQRFTIGHEMGHYILHTGRTYTVDSTVRLNFRDDLSSRATDSEEIEANKFAAELLMPGVLVRDAAAEIGRSRGGVDEDHVIELLARQFDVSTEAMSFRLLNLGIRV